MAVRAACFILDVTESVTGSVIVSVSKDISARDIGHKRYCKTSMSKNMGRMTTVRELREL